MTRTGCALALVSLSFAAVTAAPVLSAPIVWEPADGGNGHLYQVVRVGTDITWDSARARAKALGTGWDLAAIASADENAFVKSLIANADRTFFRRFISNFNYSASLGPWIGGFNVTGPYSFQWVTGEPVSYTNWVPPYFVDFPADGHRIAYVEMFDFDLFFSGIFWGHPALDTRRPIAFVAENSQSPKSLSLTLSRATVAGCRKVTGTVTLLRPAPSAGLVVKLSETLQSASSPLTLSIAAGATSGTFTIMTRPVTERETGTVRATLGGTTRSKQLAVRPMGLASLAFATPTVVGGNKTVGTGTLECKAAPGPITVELESSRPAVAYPVAASISVPQGTKSATFDVATNAVLSKTTATITGTANGITRSKVVTVIPATAVNPASSTSTPD